MLKVNNKDARTTPISIVNFEEVNADWDGNFQTWARDKNQTYMVFINSYDFS